LRLAEADAERRALEAEGAGRIEEANREGAGGEEGGVGASGRGVDSETGFGMGEERTGAGSDEREDGRKVSASEESVGS
jgi:hypothetical protein